MHEAEHERQDKGTIRKCIPIKKDEAI